MQRTAHRCPNCSRPLWIQRDMWGPYYLCEDCGWTAEDDDDLVPAQAAAALAPLIEAGGVIPSRPRTDPS